MKPLILTYHALIERIRPYGLDMADVERAVRSPDWVEPEPGRSEVERRFLAHPSTGHRALRVAVVEEADHIRVLSAHPDRNARPPHDPS
jgi:hypothetical protein